jgi:uncharacterized membrane protein YczE
MLIRRGVQLLGGLLLFGISIAAVVKARLGLGSWDVLHQGLSRRLGWPFGVTIVAVSAVVLLMWIPLRQRPGIGTLADVVIVGAVADRTLAVLPDIGPLGSRVALLVCGVLLNGVATGMYLGAGLGAGSRDGLMTGLAARGVPLRVARTGIEVTVLASGWALGGTVGIGTVLFALAIGPIVHITVPWFQPLKQIARP